MPDASETAAALRARHDHHAATKAAAEAERARLIADRTERGALLSDRDLDEVDQEIARLVDVIERATSRIALIRPALDRAVADEAAAERRQRTAGGSAQDVGTVAAVTEAFGVNAGAVTAAELRGASIPVRQPNARMFDEPAAPRMQRNDASWWEARERREREERAARLAASAGMPASRSAPDFAVFRGGK